MKTCTKCKQPKALDLFSAHVKAVDGKQSQCKACFAERARLRRVARPCITCATPLPADAKRGARSCVACLLICNACKAAPRAGKSRLCGGCQAAVDKERKATPEVKFRERITRIASKYQVNRTLAAVLAACDVCNACGKACNRIGEAHVDHCHATGQVRGILCFNCNAALGHVGDSKDRLLSLVAYLDQTESTKLMEDLRKAQHYIQKLIEMQV
jgi:hypothetical protein